MDKYGSVHIKGKYRVTIDPMIDIFQIFGGPFCGATETIFCDIW